MNSFKLLVLCCGVLFFCSSLAGCSFEEAPPHSEYFIVTFAPGTQELSAQGVTALGNAGAAATRGGPASVEIRGVASPDDEAAAALERRRADVARSALVKAGVPPGIVRIEIEPVPAPVYSQRGDDLIIAISYGERPKQP